MLSFVHKSFLHVRRQSGLLNGYVSLFAHSFCSRNSNNDSVLVSYLIKSCGLSHRSALNASKLVNDISDLEKPDRVLEFFRSHSFSGEQIAKIVRYFPRVLMLNPERSLLPKLQFFYSKGISRPELAHILSSSPTYLSRSLDNSIIPFLNYLEHLFKSEEKALTVFKRSFFRSFSNPETDVPARFDVFKSYGVPESNILWLLYVDPTTFCIKLDYLKNILERLRELGFNPQSVQFISAFRVMRKLSKAKWERKVSVCEKWGWSEEMVNAAFLKQPSWMGVAEEKIMAVMDYFVNKLGYESTILAKWPVTFSYSLERRIMPMTKVLKPLEEKGLLKKRCGLTPITLSEAVFRQRYVYQYQKEAPEVLKLYNDCFL